MTMTNFHGKICKYKNQVEVKFVWRISGPPLNAAHLDNYMFGYLHDIHIGDCIEQNRLPINRKKTNLKFYKNFMYFLKIEKFYGKIVNSSI